MSSPALSTARSFDPIAKSLHWSMGILWLAVWVIGYVAVTWRDALNPHHGVTIAHKALASVLLVLIVVRVAWRLTHPAPAFPNSMGHLAQKAAHAGHVFLYVVALIALPLSGWFWSSVADKPIMLLWTLPLPPLVAPNPELYDLAKAIHVNLAWAAAAIVVGHIALALKHYWIDKDGILESMLPRAIAQRWQRKR